MFLGPQTVLFDFSIPLINCQFSYDRDDFLEFTNKIKQITC